MTADCDPENWTDSMFKFQRFSDYGNDHDDCIKQYTLEPSRLGNLLIVSELEAAHGRGNFRRYSVYQRCSMVDTATIKTLDSSDSDKIMIDTDFLTAQVGGKSIFEYASTNIPLMNRLFSLVEALELSSSNDLTE